MCDSNVDVSNMLMEYIKDNKNNKIGLLMTGIVNDKINFGWSLCSKYDNFDKDVAYKIAKGRLLTNERWNDSDIDLPLSVIRYSLHFFNRVIKYYKNGKFSRKFDCYLDYVNFF